MDGSILICRFKFISISASKFDIVLGDGWKMFDQVINGAITKVLIKMIGGEVNQFSCCGRSSVNRTNMWLRNVGRRIFIDAWSWNCGWIQ